MSSNLAHMHPSQPVHALAFPAWIAAAERPTCFTMFTPSSMTLAGTALPLARCSSTAWARATSSVCSARPMRSLPCTSRG